VQILNK
nr:Chain C, VQILNK [Homo sapiens]